MKVSFKKLISLCLAGVTAPLSALAHNGVHDHGAWSAWLHPGSDLGVIITLGLAVALLVGVISISRKDK